MRRPRPTGDPQSASEAYARALRWLTARELSEGQIRTRLRERGFSPQAVAEAIERLRAERVVDDRRTAEALARTGARVKRHGPRRILARLAASHIDRELADDVVRELFAGDDEAALIEQAIERRLRAAPERLTDAAERRRLLAYLVRQGFSASVAAAVLRKKTK